jgi:hypothetical protein
MNSKKLKPKKLKPKKLKPKKLNIILVIILSFSGSGLCVAIIQFVSGLPKTILGMFLLQALYAGILFSKFKKMDISIDNKIYKV